MTNNASNAIAWTFAGIVSLAIIALVLWAVPNYNVYRQELRGKAILREAEYTRQVAALDAQAEIERARGVAEANKIIGNSLQGNEAYIRYLFIDKLTEVAKAEGTQVIYIPTEGSIPILEATRAASPAN